MDAARTERVVLAAVGLAQGVVFWWAHTGWPESESARAYVMALVAFVAVAGIATQFAWTGRDVGRLVGIAISTGAVFAAITLWVWMQFTPAASPFQGEERRMETWWIAAPLALYALGPYLQIHQRTGRYRFAYPDLFFHGWCNVFIGALGLAFAAVFWTVILLWARLFALIGVDVFERTLLTWSFAVLVLPVLFGYGVARGRDSARVTEAARTTMLAVFRLLLPMLGAISLLFLAMLPFTGLAGLWATRRAGWLLLWLVAFAILFVNAAVEDARGDPPYVPAVRRIVEATMLALPVFAWLALHALGLRIAQYGLTVERFRGVVVTAVLGLYAVGYAIAALVRRGPWMGGLRPVNVAMSFVVAAAALLTHTPILDPLAWSARQQYARLASGGADAATFDYPALRFHFGRAGYDAFERLERLTTHRERDVIQAGIASARLLHHYGERPAAVARVLQGEDLVLIGGLAAVPDGLAAEIGASQRNWGSVCAIEHRCFLFALDLDGDGSSEYCAVLGPSFYEAPCWGRSAQGWRRLGLMRPWNEGGTAGVIEVQPDLLDRLRAGQARTVPPRYADIEIGHTVFRLLPN